MNPLNWKPQRQVAGLAFCVVGTIVGILCAWINSPFRVVSFHALSSEWANPPNVFLIWLTHIQLYWPWPIIGACAGGLAFYGRQLSRR
jgi:hypothetical protein